MRLVIVSGATATGKTTLANIIATKLKYILYSKDAIKEKLYDSPVNEKHGYFWYEKKAKNIYLDSIRANLLDGKSVIIESNFLKNDKIRLKSLINESVQVTEIYCKARGFTRLKRFISRGEGETRHKAHNDRRWYPTIFIGVLLNCIGIQWPYGPVGVTDKVLYLDTTDVSEINIKKIIEFIKLA